MSQVIGKDGEVVSNEWDFNNPFERFLSEAEDALNKNDPEPLLIVDKGLHPYQLKAIQKLLEQESIQYIVIDPTDPSEEERILNKKLMLSVNASTGALDCLALGESERRFYPLYAAHEECKHIALYSPRVDRPHYRTLEKKNKKSGYKK